VDINNEWYSIQLFYAVVTMKATVADTIAISLSQLLTVVLVFVQLA